MAEFFWTDSPWPDQILKRWDLFIEGAAAQSRFSSESWSRFYQFVVACFMSTQGIPRVSDVITRARESGISKPGSVGVAYAHCLESHLLYLRESS